MPCGDVERFMKCEDCGRECGRVHPRECSRCGKTICVACDRDVHIAARRATILSPDSPIGLRCRAMPRARGVHPPPLPGFTERARAELARYLDPILPNTELLSEMAGELNRRTGGTSFTADNVGLVLYELHHRCGPF